MVNPSSTSPPEPVLVVGFGDPIAADYSAFVEKSGGAVAREVATCPAGSLAVVLWLPARLEDASRTALDSVLAFAAQRKPSSITLVSSVRAHLGDGELLALESYTYQVAKRTCRRTAILRAGHVLSDSSPFATGLRRFAHCAPLVPSRLRTCCVAGEELFALVERTRKSERPRRLSTLLGPNRPLRDWLAERSTGVLGACVRAVCWVLSLLLIGQLGAFLFRLFANRLGLRSLDFDTLRPTSLRELLALSCPANREHVRVVGYNNGVNHFGQRYPGRTVVSTVLCNRVRRVSAAMIRADSGTTVRKALDFLARDQQELYVTPNYSYVCVGTAFFVPIHGSASDYSTIADTLAGAVLYDPASDQVLRVKRDDPAFREHLYNAKSNVVVLQLLINVKPKSRYFMRQEDLPAPSADDLLRALRDTEATNVEVRKSRASDATVRLVRFYNDSGSTTSQVEELPRDKLGRLWDRLEENPVTSFLMHALTRHLAYHVELFFSDDEFRTFWATCGSQGLRKIQLRHIRRDGFPHSPFRDHDCVSADLFMFRRHQRAFEAYLKQTFAIVRSNPGKHSA